jgi:hypothetical protein
MAELTEMAESTEMAEMAELTTCTLADRPDLLDAVVESVWSEWARDFVELPSSYGSMQALRDRYASFPSSCFLLACPRAGLLASCLVDDEDMGVRPDIRAWLTNVVVPRRHRGRGHAAALLSGALRAWPARPLHLWTSDQGLARFYSRFGFEALAVLPEHGRHRDVIVMVLQEPPPLSNGSAPQG